MPIPKCLLILICVATLLPASGCQRKATRPIGVVRGKITVDKQPLSGGTILFENPSLGVSTTGPIGADGNYTVRTYLENGLPVGSYQVSVSSQRVVSDGIDIIGQNKAQGGSTVTIPEKYRTIKSTPLTADVKEGDNPGFDFDLNSK